LAPVQGAVAGTIGTVTPFTKPSSTTEKTVAASPAAPDDHSAKATAVPAVATGSDGADD
jgi:hypothetical protein